MPFNEELIIFYKKHNNYLTEDLVNLDKGMMESDTLFVEEIKIDCKITTDDARDRQH